MHEVPAGQGTASPRDGCGTDSLPGDFVLRNADASYFYGIRGPLLLMDNGTGNVRELTLYDIRSHRQVLRLESYDIAGRRGDTLALWLGTSSPSSGCTIDPRFGGVQMDSLYELRLPSLAPVATGRTRRFPIE